MKIDKYGQVEITEAEAFEALYSGKLSTLENVHIEGEQIIKQYNQSRDLNADRIPKLLLPKDLTDVDQAFFDESNQCDWFMPEEYNTFDIVEYLYSQCNTQIQRDRVAEELVLFIQYGMFDLLVYLKYLVDTMRENRVVWGVGRGSSVASYCLYLLGVHKVDSIKYELDIKEFLK